VGDTSRFTKNIALRITHTMKKKIWIYSSLFLLFAAYAVLRVQYLDAIPRWDASTYFHGLRSAIVSILTIDDISTFPLRVINNFNLFGHPSMGYLLTLVPSQLFGFPNIFLMNLTNLVLAMMSIAAFHLILLYFLPDDRYAPERIVATGIYAFDPLFFGSSIFLNTDFPVLVFLTLCLAALLYRRHFMFCVAALFMIFSKELGILLYGGITIGLAAISAPHIFECIKGKKAVELSRLLTLPAGTPPKAEKRSDWKSRIRPAMNIFFIVLPGILFILYFFLNPKPVWEGIEGLSVNSNGWNCFGFRPFVSVNRTEEIFLLNFHWILSGITAAVLSLMTVRRILKKDNTTGKLMERIHPALIVIVSSFLIFFLFNFFYITFIIPRYTVASGFYLILFSVIAVIIAFKKQAVRVAVLSVILVLFFIQTFRTVDPVSKKVFGTFSLGKHEFLRIDNPKEAVGNAFVYNAEFTLVDKLLNMMQKEIRISSDTTLVTYYEDTWFSFLDTGTALIDGRNYERTFDPRYAFPYKILPVHRLNPVNAPAEAYYVYMPWLAFVSNEKRELSIIKRTYDIGQPKVIGYSGYYLKVYRITKKTDLSPKGRQL
jgi:hypothetical protein